MQLIEIYINILFKKNGLLRERASNRERKFEESQ